MLRVESNKPCRIVYSLYQHEYLGCLFEPHIVQLSNNGDLSLTHQKLYSHTATEFAEFLDETDYKLIRLMDECDQEYIIKKYHKSPVRPNVFFPAHYDERMHSIIRPNIERRMAEALSLMDEKDVFEMGKEGNPAGKKLKIANGAASVLFHFRRGTEGTRYFPTIKLNGERIEFMFRDAQIICNQPAWMLLADTLIFFEGDMDGKKLIPFLNKRYIDIPPSSEPAYYKKFVSQLVEKYNVYAEGFDIITQKFDARPILKVVHAWDNSIQLVLSFRYGEYLFPYQSGSKVSVSLETKDDQYIFHRIKRSLGWEATKIQALKQLGAMPADGSAFVLPELQDEEISDEQRLYRAFEWLNENNKDLLAAGFEVEQEEKGRKFFLGNYKIDLEIKEGSDWFDIYATVSFGDFVIPFIDLRNHILSGKKEFMLPNGEIAVIPDKWFSEYSQLFSFAEQGKNLKLKKHHLGLIKEYADNNLAVLTIDRKLNKLSNFEEIDEVSIPVGFKGELRPYQKAGFDWFYFLRKFNFGGCLADDMGLGKTIQTLALLQKIKEEHEQSANTVTSLSGNQFNTDVSFRVNPLTSLIVMPTSLIHNWLNEAKKFTPDLKIMIYTGTDRLKDTSVFADYDLVLTTYGIVRLDKDLLKDFYFHYIILDESQIIKNPGSKIARAVKILRSRHKLILSGTPIENSVTDLWSQMSFVNPGLLGGQTYFHDQFVIPIEKKKDIAKAERLQALIKPFVLRRTKIQVASELPEKIEHVYYSSMSTEQEQIYEETKSYYRNEILRMLTENGISRTQMPLLQGLSRLRQIANHPELIDPEYTGDSGKFTDVLITLENAIQKGHKILVFSQFVKHLSLFRKKLDEQAISYAYLDGSTSNREQVVNSFRESDIKLFLISIKAGGVGLNLTEADYVFILDPWWNPAVEQQAIDRTHRIGQTKSVFIYKFITKNSVEEKILALQQKKKVLADALISIEDSFFKSLTEEDIKAILE